MVNALQVTIPGRLPSVPSIKALGNARDEKKLHNVGRDYTFECKTGKSVIDITLSRNLKLKIEHWKVCKAYNHSDHNTIKYNVTTDIIEIKPRRQYESADWDIFKAELQKQDLHIPKIITQEKLELMVNKLNNCITTELDKVCPILPAKIINKNNPWWTDQLNQMRKELFTLYDKSKTNPDTQELYKLKLKKYRKKCSIESKKDARRIQEIIENEQEMPKHVNMMTETSSPKLSTLTLKQGHNTDPGKETGKACLLYTSPSPRD